MKIRFGSSSIEWKSSGHNLAAFLHDEFISLAKAPNKLHHYDGTEREGEGANVVNSYSITIFRKGPQIGIQLVSIQALVDPLQSSQVYISPDPKAASSQTKEQWSLIEN